MVAGASDTLRGGGADFEGVGVPVDGNGGGPGFEPVFFNSVFWVLVSGFFCSETSFICS